MKVITLKHMDISGQEMLKEAGIELIKSQGTTEEDFIKEIKEHQVDGIFCRTDKVTKAMMDASPNLKCIAKQGVGIDNIDMDYATEQGIQVVFAPGGNSNAVAEHTIMLMLMTARRWRYVNNQMRDNNFEVRYTLHNTFELKGMTLGLLGCGRIGQMVAKIASNGFGMRVIGYDPFPPKNPLVHIDMMEMDEVLKNADFVSLHMPSLPSTIHTINYDKLCLMKPTAHFINCARGDVVVEEDLIRVMKEGKIQAAGLDVFDQEPLTMENELLHLDEVISTPHTAATTIQSVDNCTHMAVQSLIEALRGENVTYPANKIVKK